MSEKEEMARFTNVLIDTFFCKETAKKIVDFAKELEYGFMQKGFIKEQTIELIKVCLGSKSGK